jgi:hypothetical protein
MGAVNSRADDPPHTGHEILAGAVPIGCVLSKGPSRSH